MRKVKVKYNIYIKIFNFTKLRDFVKLNIFRAAAD